MQNVEEVQRGGSARLGVVVWYSFRKIGEICGKYFFFFFCQRDYCRPIKQIGIGTRVDRTRYRDNLAGVSQTSRYDRDFGYGALFAGVQFCRGIEKIWRMV